MIRPLTIFVSHPSDLITDHRVHGDGAVAYEQIQRLAERGHQLHVAYTSVDLLKPLHKNVTLHKITCRFPSSRVQDLEYLFHVRRLFWRLHRRQPFDLIHQFHTVFAGRSAFLTHTGLPLILGVFVAGWPSGVEAAAEPMRWHSRLARALINPVLSFANRWQQRHATALLLSTPAAESCLYEPERTHSRSVLLWCPGVNADYYTPDRSGHTTGSNQPRTLLFVGNLERRKGIFVLVEAFRTIWKQQPDVRLLFVGDGTQREALRRFIEEDESRKNVEMLGRVSDEVKRQAIRSASLVIIPSFGEPYGNVATESMACAKPLIITRAGGLQYLVPPEGGRLVPPADAPALGQAALELLAQPEKWEAMGAANRRLVDERFAWDRVIDRLEETYHSVLQRTIRHGSKVQA